MNALVQINATKQFREEAADTIQGASQMTLHELVDEYTRLCGVVADNLDRSDEHHQPQPNEHGQIADKHSSVIAGVIRARFGLIVRHEDSYGYGFDDAPF